MKTLTNQTTLLTLDFPRTWKPESLTELSIQIADVDGNELLAADEVPLYVSTTLSADARRYTRSIVITDPEEEEEEDPVSSALKTGDLIRIVGILGYEDHVVKGYDVANTTAELEDYLDRDFEAGAAVYRLSAEYTVELSDIDVFVPGLQIVITWTPIGTGDIVTELAEIETTSQIDVAAFTRDFSALYPRAYNALKNPADRLDTILRLAQDELRMTLTSRGLDIARVKDQRLIAPPLMALVALKWSLGGDEKTADEQVVMSKAYSAALETFCQMPIWVDSDGDGEQGEDEVEDHPVYFERVW